MLIVPDMVRHSPYQISARPLTVGLTPLLACSQPSGGPCGRLVLLVLLHPAQARLSISNHEGKSGTTQHFTILYCPFHIAAAACTFMVVMRKLVTQLCDIQFRQDPGTTVFVGIEGRLDSFYRATLEHLAADNCTVLYDEKEVSPPSALYI